MTSIRDWVKKHRKALVLSVGLLGAGYICYRTVKSHHNRMSMEKEERETHAFLLRQAEQRIEAQLQIHFQSIQRISDTTTLPSILPRLKSQLFSQLDFSDLTEKLAQGKDASGVLSGQEKIELWEKLKILSFTRSICSMWGLTILVLFVRVQLNILARHVYLDAARDISTMEQVKKALSKACQQKYISFSEFLPDKGIKILISDVEAAVVDVLARKPLKEPCSLADLREIFESICKSMEPRQADWLAYMLPKKNLPADNGDSPKIRVGYLAECGEEDMILYNDVETLEQLLVETRLILDSQEFQEVLTTCFAAVLDGVMEEFEEFFERGGAVRFPLAKLLPPVSGVGVLLLEQPDDNKFIQLITDLEEVRSFCATVYSAGQ